MSRLIKVLFFITLFVVIGLIVTGIYGERLIEEFPEIGKLSKYLKEVTRTQRDRLQVYLERPDVDEESLNRLEDASGKKPAQTEGNPEDPFYLNADSRQTGTEADIQIEGIKFESIDLPKPYPIYALVAENDHTENQITTEALQQSDGGNHSTSKKVDTMPKSTIKAEEAIEILRTIRGGLGNE